MAPAATATPQTERPLQGLPSLPAAKPIRRLHASLGLEAARLRRLDDDAVAMAVPAHGAAAFNLLYERFSQRIFGYCCAILRDRTEAEDALQETMARAYRHLWIRPDGATGTVAIKPWLMTVARNACIDRIRSRARTDDSGRLEDVIDGVPCAQSSVIERERLRALLEDLSELSESQRSAIALREMAGLGHDEIATALGTTSARSKSLISEARQTLTDRALGREMPCEDLRNAVAERGNRALRGKQIRAHAQSCARCDEFVSQRRPERVLAAFAPLLPAANSDAVLASILGGGVGTAGAGGLISVLGGLGGGKGLAVIAAVGAVGGGAIATDMPQRIASNLPDLPSVERQGPGDSATRSVQLSDGASPPAEPDALSGADAVEDAISPFGPLSAPSLNADEPGRQGAQPGKASAPSSGSGASSPSTQSGTIQQSPNPGGTLGSAAPAPSAPQTSPAPAPDLPAFSLPSSPPPPSRPEPPATSTPSVPDAPAPPSPGERLTDRVGGATDRVGALFD